LLDRHGLSSWAGRKLTNFARPSYSIAAAMPVFHACKAALLGETVD
jgi:hypothetical protein